MLLLTAHGPVAAFRCVILVAEIGKILEKNYLKNRILKIELKNASAGTDVILASSCIIRSSSALRFSFSWARAFSGSVSIPAFRKRSAASVADCFSAFVSLLEIALSPM